VELLHTGQVLLWFDQIVCAAARRLRGLSSKSMEDVEGCSNTVSATSNCCRMAASTLHGSMVLIVPAEWHHSLPYPLELQPISVAMQNSAICRFPHLPNLCRSQRYIHLSPVWIVVGARRAWLSL